VPSRRENAIIRRSAGLPDGSEDLKMSRDIAEQLRSYIENEMAASIPDGGLMPDTPLIESGLVDSLGLFKLIAFMEDNLDVSVAPEEIVFENFATVNAIVDLVRSKRPPA
jgi:acyl carrier protein